MSSNKKIKLGQFFTTGYEWLKPHVKEFIVKSNCTVAYDRWSRTFIRGRFFLWN
ncbi:MAG: hypothetical protein ACOX3T_01605 [Bdellovibrionota bacterium]